MRVDKVAAARRLIATLGSDEDVTDYATDHPNEVCGLDRLLKDLASEPTADNMGKEQWS